MSLPTEALILRRFDLAAPGADPEAVLAMTRRGVIPDRRIRAAVREILDEIRTDPYRAVREASSRYGGGLPDGRLVIGADELRRACDALPADARRALDQAVANVRAFAERQRPESATTVIAPGVEIERRWTPVARVGCYVPGGTAPYPSSLVMTVVPARVAGVDAVVVATPADRDGRVDPLILGAAGLLGVDSLVVAGGAQAIGALAFGLPGEDLAPVDLIVGPGNAWVTAAKLELAGEVAIDLPAGPSEGMVLAGPPSDPERIAADLLTQAEHGPDSPAILVTTDERFADAVEAAAWRQLATAGRREILERALVDNGAIVLTADIAAAVDFVNAYAPEHLSVDVEPLEPTVAAVRNAGSVFVGPWAPESAGDYATGANHVLPTGGLARASGPLAVEAYGKFSQVQRISREGLASLRETIGTLAAAEGLLAHREAVEIRFRATEAER